MKVSALIATHNRRTFVSRAIDSVLAQTVPVDEIIVVDDGSTDGTAEAIGRRYGPRVALIRQENRGVAAARQRGIKEARGEWVAFLDSDDVWLPTKLEQQFSALATLGKGFGLCFTNCAFAGDPNKTLSAFEQAGLESQSEFGPLGDPVTYALAKSPAIYLPSLLVLRSLLEELGGFDEALVVEEDVDLIFRLAFGTSFCFVSAPLVMIDATPFRLRLTGLCSDRTDRIYACSDRRYRKWLALPQVSDAQTRQTIQDQLCDLYYSWAIARLYQLRFSGALQKISEIREMGDSYITIFATLLGRAARKLARSLSAASGLGPPIASR